MFGCSLTWNVGLEAVLPELRRDRENFEIKNEVVFQKSLCIAFQDKMLKQVNLGVCKRISAERDVFLGL